MRTGFLYAAYGLLLLSGVLQFAIDVVSQHLRGRRMPGAETTLYYGLNSAYALGQVTVAVVALLALRGGASFLSHWTGLMLAFFAAAGWLTIAFVFMEYREPRNIMMLFTLLLVAATLATAPDVPQAQNIIKERSVRFAPAERTEDYTVDAVISADGTKIGYRRIGGGPGLILVQGAMQTAHNYDELARSLAGDFTVYLPDRRGRGISPLAYSTAHSIRRDVEDLDAVLVQTGASYVFGLSSGAVIVLEACRTLPAIRKAALYEPPFYVDGMPLKRVVRFNEEVGRGELGAALATAGSIVGLGPAWLRFVPHSLQQVVTNAIVNRERERGAEPYAPMHELIPAMRYDFNVVAGMDGQIRTFASVSTKIQLLGGTASPSYLSAALDSLHSILPNAERIEFQDLDHSGAWNVDRGGQPERVARSLRHFFRH